VQPHELSSGQRQRVNIARAIATNHRFVVLDEPTSALDVSLRSRNSAAGEIAGPPRGLSYLYISHDLATVKYLAGRVAVMYLGSIVEVGATHELFTKPLHPYTRALLASVPVPDPDAKRDAFTLAGEIPSPMDTSAGCRLRGRCPLATSVCAESVPLREIAPGRFVACHLAWMRQTGLRSSQPRNDTMAVVRFVFAALKPGVDPLDYDNHNLFRPIARQQRSIAAQDWRPVI
jgi:peptide/nickel transport system ATP-binding protein